MLAILLFSSLTSANATSIQDQQLITLGQAVIEDRTSDSSFEDFEADFQFVIYKLVPVESDVSYVNLPLPPGLHLPPSVSLPQIPSSSIPNMGDFGKTLSKLGAGSSMPSLPQASEENAYRGMREIPVICSGKLDRPHRSFHRPGVINAQAKIKCSHPIAEMTGEVKLSADSIPTVSSGIKTVKNTRNWTHNVTRPCENYTREHKATVAVRWQGLANHRPPSGEVSATKSHTFKC